MVKIERFKYDKIVWESMVDKENNPTIEEMLKLASKLQEIGIIGFDELGNKITTLVNLYKSLEKEAVDAKKELDIAREGFSKLDSELKQALSEKIVATQKISELEQSALELNEKYNKAQTLVEELNAKIQDYEAQIKDYAASYEELSKSTGEKLAKVIDALVAKEEEIKKLSEEKEKIRKELEWYKKEIPDITHEVFLVESKQETREQKNQETNGQEAAQMRTGVNIWDALNYVIMESCRKMYPEINEEKEIEAAAKDISDKISKIVNRQEIDKDFLDKMPLVGPEIIMMYIEEKKPDDKMLNDIVFGCCSAIFEMKKDGNLELKMEPYKFKFGRFVKENNKRIDEMNRKIYGAKD